MPEDFHLRQEAWYRSVAGVFARVERRDVADVPLDVWRKLIRTTYDGIDVRPLYTRADEFSESAAPGVFPFTRGNEVKDARRAGWGVTETFGRVAGEGAASVNKRILHALYNGTTDLVLDLTGDLTVGDLREVLGGVLLDLVPLRIVAGAETRAAADELYAVIDAADNPGRVSVELSCAPLTAPVDSSASVDLDTAVDLAVEASGRAGEVRAILVDGASFSNQGATDAQEIGFALAAGVEYLRALVDAGLDTASALRQISFRFAATDDQFAQIAKFRAARELWARVAEVVGHAEDGGAPQHALTAPVMFSQRDPWVNMLRSTVAAFAAGVGGATDVEVLPFDAAVRGGLQGTSRSFAHRIARNTNLLLLEESHLGFVVDPGGGSYFIEDLTRELADAAWSIFTGVEADGGFRSHHESGALQSALDESHEAVRADVAHRRKQITGINEFPNLAEKPLPADRRVEPAGVRRWAAGFEALRNRSDAFLEEHGSRPRAVLIPIGPLAKHNVRTGFATNLLASGGIEVVNPGQLVPGTDEFTEAVKDAEIAVLCGADPEYTATGAEAVRAARAAGVGTLLVAGSPKSFAETEDTPDDYLNLTIDAAATLAGLLETLGA
ncbi:methylmalonyl-CoA mutase family protein [Corynebacterium sp. P7003]|uniref:Methylmalonyl-CoA mutase family protein n=1 Tax=Corynebacterium pygosceleis TaxID=2800406 RepID=A0ABT3WNB5_9CORY|nr:methylmalonyl-CoA mutase family protein [Corynebacterium pygosceleis]MCX7443744.1 methylmalonyl-CoA mutase family protein [Corynebacterium pygosceleis]